MWSTGGSAYLEGPLRSTYGPAYLETLPWSTYGPAYLAGPLKPTYGLAYLESPLWSTYGPAYPEALLWSRRGPAYLEESPKRHVSAEYNLACVRRMTPSADLDNKMCDRYMLLGHHTMCFWRRPRQTAVNHLIQSYISSTFHVHTPPYAYTATTAKRASTTVHSIMPKTTCHTHARHVQQ